MKKKIRRLAAAFLSLLLLLSLAACGGKGSERQQDNGAEPPEDSGQVETGSKSPHDHTSKGNKGGSDTPPARSASGDMNGLDHWDDPDGWEPAGDDSWLPPTDEGLADSQWNCGEDWYMELGNGNCDPDYAGIADLHYQFEDEQEYQLFYSGVWRMDGDCLRLELSAGVGTSASGSFPVLIDPSGDHLYIQQSRDDYTCPPFFDDDMASMELTRSYG